MIICRTSELMNRENSDDDDEIRSLPAGYQKCSDLTGNTVIWQTASLNVHIRYHYWTHSPYPLSLNMLSNFDYVGKLKILISFNDVQHVPILYSEPVCALLAVGHGSYLVCPSLDDFHSPKSLFFFASSRSDCISASSSSV